MVATLLYTSGTYGPLGSGIMERLAVDPIAVWLAIVGIWLLRRFLVGPWIRRHHSGRRGSAPVAG